MNSRSGTSSPPASALNIRSQMPRVSVGKSGPIRAHCPSENQKKSGISIASSLETMNRASPALGIPLMGPDPRLDCVTPNECCPLSGNYKAAEPTEFRLDFT